MKVIRGHLPRIGWHDVLLFWRQWTFGFHNASELVSFHYFVIQVWEMRSYRKKEIKPELMLLHFIFGLKFICSFVLLFYLTTAWGQRPSPSTDWWMVLDYYDGQMVFGDKCGLNFQTFVLQLREIPRKTPTRKLTRPGFEPEHAGREATPRLQQWSKKFIHLIICADN